MVLNSRKNPDYTLLLTVAALLGIGIVMVYSSSVVKAQAQFGDGLHFLKRQLFWATLGLVAMVTTMNIDYWHWARLGRAGFLLTLVLLAVVLVPGVGVVVNGARRWIGAGPLQFQPSELMKTAIVLFMAEYLTRRREQIKGFWQGLMPALLIVGAVFALIMAEPDMGTALAITGTVGVMLFAAGANLRHLGTLAFSSLPLLGLLIWLEPYRLRRLTSFINPFADPQNSGYHIIQSLYALGSGGLFGVGLGRSRQKFWYLPEQHTDFIFAIIGEEMGFLGAVVVVSLFFVFIWRGLRVAVGAPDRFSSLLAAGVTAMVGVQACINLGVVTSSLPITGIPLPFLSYGGSSLVFTMAGVGLLLGVSRYADR